MSNIIFKTLLLKGEAGNSIGSIEKTATSGIVDTYTITLTDGSTTTFQVTNGSDIATIEKTATSGLVDTYTVTLTNGSTTTFQVTNGSNGSDINIAPIEETSTASRAYSVGNYLIYNQLLYQVTNSISSGDTITVGTNVERVLVSGELKEIQDILAGKQDGLAKGGFTGNIDNLKKSGFYLVNASTATGTMPSDYSYFSLLVFKVQSSELVQLAIPTYGNSPTNNASSVYMRHYYNNSWHPWVSIYDNSKVTNAINTIGTLKIGTLIHEGYIFNDTNTEIGSIVFDSTENGLWLFEGIFEFPANANGYRGMSITTLSGTGGAMDIREQAVQSSGVKTKIQLIRLLRVEGITEGTTKQYILNVRQNSGSDMASGWNMQEFRAVRIR